MTDRGREIIVSHHQGVAWLAAQEEEAKALSEKAAWVPLERMLLPEELARFTSELDTLVKDPEDFLRTRIHRYVDPNDKHFPPELDMIGCLNWAVTNLRDMPFA
jgi:hypothetical protein